MPESCEICEIFKNTFFTEHLQRTASGQGLFQLFPFYFENLLQRFSELFIALDVNCSFLFSATLNKFYHILT